MAQLKDDVGDRNDNRTGPLGTDSPGPTASEQTGEVVGALEK